MLRMSVCVAGVLMLAQSARAQAFFYPGATAFTPQISIVNTGVILDVQATVSADRKYVTMTMRPQQSTLLDLRAFTFQNGQNPANGNVGDPPRANPPAGKDDPAGAVRTSPTEILAYAKAQASILHRPGMTRISSLKN